MSCWACIMSVPCHLWAAASRGALSVQSWQVGSISWSPRNLPPGKERLDWGDKAGIPPSGLHLMLPWYSCSCGPNNRKHEGSGGETGAREAAQIFMYVEAINPPQPISSNLFCVGINEVIFSHLIAVKTFGSRYRRWSSSCCASIWGHSTICQAGQGAIFWQLLCSDVHDESLDLALRCALCSLSK